MLLVVKGAKWQARLEAEKRGIVWDEDDPHNPKPTRKGESIIYCAEKYRAQVVAWFCEPERPAIEGIGFPVGTVLYHN